MPTLTPRHLAHGKLPILQKVLHIGREDLEILADGDVNAAGSGCRALVADVIGLLVVGRKRYLAKRMERTYT